MDEHEGKLAHVPELEEQAINPQTRNPSGSVSGGSQGAWDPEKISRDIESARRKQNPEEKRWGFEQYNPEQIARDVEAARQKQNPERPLPKPRDPEYGALKRRVAGGERQKAAQEPINFSAGRKSILRSILDKAEDWLREPAPRYRGATESPTPSFADEFQHPQLKNAANALEAERATMSLEEYVRQQQIVRDVRDGTIADVEDMRNALRGRPLTTEESNEQARQQFCQEMDDRNAMIQQIIISTLGPQWRLLPAEDISRLELEMRHGGEERHGGESAEIQMAKLKAKLIDILKRRGPSCTGPRQTERDSEREEGSDWLENSGFWHK
ncbi:MAG TPA: hypothetical protein VN948_08980 [Terriglobales bacterium]|nr:hypothetical protein [Terriglobales bacterium]